MEKPLSRPRSEPSLTLTGGGRRPLTPSSLPYKGLRPPRTAPARSQSVGDGGLLGSDRPPSRGFSAKIYTRQWTSEQKRLLHERRERAWLRNKGRHACIDFSDEERAALRRYFDCLAESNSRIKLDKLEDFLISLGLASTRHDVQQLVKAISKNASVDIGSYELDFEEYLEIVRQRADSAIFKVFKAMMEGNLGDQNLNFQTVISEYRRHLILDATGARGATPEVLDRCRRIMINFADLQYSRFKEVHGTAPIRREEKEKKKKHEQHSFDPNVGHAPLGGLGMLWRGVCSDQNLVETRPASTEGKSRRVLEKPLSPRSVIRSIVDPTTAHNPNKSSFHRGTVMVSAPMHGPLKATHKLGLPTVPDLSSDPFDDAGFVVEMKRVPSTRVVPPVA